MSTRWMPIVLVVAAGCSADPVSVAVSFEFDPIELQDEAVFIEIRTQADSCFPIDLSLPALRLDRGPAASSARVDLDGPVYLAARARDRTCRWFARGCGRVDGPKSASGLLLINLREADSLPMCEADDCVEGACSGGDLSEGIAPPPLDAGPEPPPLDDGRDS